MELKRTLGAGTATWIVAGSMIGAGIFFMPGLVAAEVPSAGFALVAWALGGLLSLAGAAVYGELGARIPRAGGDYRYLTEAFGPFWGFLNGWAAITLTFSAAAAAQARSALAFLLPALPAPFGGAALEPWTPLLACGVVLLLTWTNVTGLRVSGRATAWLTGLPVAGLIALFVGALWFRPEVEPQVAPIAATPRVAFGLAALAAAMVPVFFTYSGWNAAAYLAGEMNRPKRDLGRALLIGTGAVTGLYLLVNLLLARLLPWDALSGSVRAPAEAAARAFGPWGERGTSWVVGLAILGSCNVTLMAGARVYYAMAEERFLPRALRRTNRAGTPSVALWVGGVWAAALALFGDVSRLVDGATLAILLLSSLTVAALFVLRRRAGGAEHDGFRCPGYPVTPAVYLAACLGVAVWHIVDRPGETWTSVALLAVGVPLYFVARWARGRRREPGAAEHR